MIFSFGSSGRLDGIGSHCCRNDESFGIVDYEGGECIFGTLNDDLIAFDQGKDVYPIIGMVCYCFCEPVPVRFDKFPFMQTGSLFYPSISFCNFFDPVQKVLLRPFSGAVPLYVL
jgi:hypothetical protein